MRSFASGNRKFHAPQSFFTVIASVSEAIYYTMR